MHFLINENIRRRAKAVVLPQSQLEKEQAGNNVDAVLVSISSILDLIDWLKCFTLYRQYFCHITAVLDLESEGAKRIVWLKSMFYVRVWHTLVFLIIGIYFTSTQIVSFRICFVFLFIQRPNIVQWVTRNRTLR